MNKKLLIQAILKYLLGLILVGSLLFIPAWSFSYFEAWLFIGLLFIPMFIVGIILFFKNPELLERRLNAKEKEKEQSTLVKISGLMFIIGFIIAGLNYHYQWFMLPTIFTILGCITFVISYLIYGEVLRENTYLSRTIGVEKEQKLIDTGLYGIIRHPMYFATIILFLSIPFILNSPISIIIFLVYPVIIVKRIINEEKILEKELKGYKEYQEKVKYRLVPFIW